MSADAASGDRTQDLVAEEGVAEGSAASTVEDSSGGAERGVLGAAAGGRPAAEEDPAPPAGEVGAQGPGQQQDIDQG